MSHSPAPLSELIAVDLGRGLATAMVTRILLSLGVRVIRFRELGDDPFDLIYPAHRSWHAGKKLVDARPGSVAFADAIATADICITGGEDHPDLPDLPAPNVLGAMNPRLVVAEILGAPAALGDTVPAVDILAQARSGLMFEELTDRPIFSALPYPSYSAAFLLATGLLAALFAKERAGTGGIVSTSLFEGALAIAAPLYLTAAQAGSRFDLVPPKSPRHMISRCADDRYLQLVMGVAGAKSKLYSALGLDTLGIDPSDRGLDAKDPMKFYGDAAFFAPFFLHRDSEAMAAALNEAGIPNAEVLAPGSAWKEPQVKALAMFTEGEDGSRFPASPFSLRVEQTDLRSTRSAEARTNPNAGPLSGVRILDLGAWIAGPLASVPLVDLGAEVIKVEPIEGDPHRFVQRSFAASNRGKRSIAIDLKSQRGMAAFRKLIATADVLVHNFRPGVAERLGIGAATLHALQPSLVVLESSAYGHDGPRSQRPGFDQLFQAFGGHLVRAAAPGMPPFSSRLMPIDMSTGLASAAAITAGLLIARRTGKGTTIHASLLQTSLFLLSELAQRQDGSFLSIKPIDAEQTGFHPAERIYRTNDGWIALAARSNGTARQLLQVLGIAGAGDVPREMWGNREAGAIAEAIADLTTNDALNLLLAGGIWAARCDDRAAAHVLFDPVLVASGLVGVAPDTRSGEVRQIGTGLGGSSFARPNSFALPELGQDSDNILAGLGFDKEEILAMRNEGILI